MIAIPYYNLIVVPGVHFYFNQEYYHNLTNEEPVVGENVVFLLTRDGQNGKHLTEESFYPIGVTGEIDQIDDDGNVSIITHDCVDLLDVRVENGNILLEMMERTEIDDVDLSERQKHFTALRSALLEFVQKYPWGIVARTYIMHWKTLEDMAVGMGTYLSVSVEEKFALLEANRTSERLRLLERMIYEFLEQQRVSEEAAEAQKESNENRYREDALQKQISYLQKQLDAMHPESGSDLDRFARLIAESGMNEEAEKEAKKVLLRMKQEGEHGHEYGMLYDYLDFVTGLSWKKENAAAVDLTEAREVLEADHYGLSKVKERIIQQLAVMILQKKQSGSILLFTGAPGTGKTSIGQSIAKALHREYARISLGGVRDEAEIRGHRRTYVGAMPGRIMEGIRRSGVSNPVVVLDEIDKLSRDYAGDPASALLEVLDPEQNSTFTDHYMNVPYDLSDVLFICTANSTDTIPEPLLNRMEVISFQGYTAIEKYEIAKRHLLPAAMKETGIRCRQLKVTDEAVRAIISDYTMEAGVRGLRKHLNTLCRAVAVKLVQGGQKSVTVSPKRLRELLDQKPIHHDQVTAPKPPGVVNGLAWTAGGGDTLFIEALFVKGSGKTLITGKLGDVMKESAQIAVSLVKSLYPDRAKQFEKHDLHIHVPSGAVPKDGPSAGVTLATAIASLVLGKPVNPQIAMTGEISLQGRVMPIGGLPEKLMAAMRAGVQTVYIPRENEEDLRDVAEEIKQALQIIPVTEFTDLLEEVWKS
ncbi:MAG: endopeptidase La [Lachnospiraceae bacterium]|nr:endopeptidase La [Lachnospiraceae bacterium]